MSMPPPVTRRLMREIRDLQSTPPEGIRIQTSDDNILDVIGIIQGPESTPYAGGYFKVKFKFTDEFPAAPPKCTMMTKIFHPNVSSSGEICVNTLKKDWKATYGIAHILVTVKCLLIYPNPESALDEQAGKLLLENYQSYCDRAKLITSIHATPRVRPVEFDTPSASTTISTTTPTPPPAPVSSTTSKTSTTIPPPVSSITTAASTPANFTLPILSRKSASPAPAPATQSLPLTSSPSNLEKEALNGPTKERHASPSPLSTADANISKKATAGIGMGLVEAPAPTSKAVKRAATGGVATGAEKRKKALKRL